MQRGLVTIWRGIGRCRGAAATAKNAEGHLQVAAGAITGDERMQAEGEAKQVQAQLMDVAGTVKDKVQQVVASVGDAIDGLGGKAH